MESRRLFMSQEETEAEYKDWMNLFLTALPNVELMRETYQEWIKVSPDNQRRMKGMLYRHSSGGLYSSQGVKLTRIHRLTLILIDAFDQWSVIQDGLGACGFDRNLMKLTPGFEDDLGNIIPLFRQTLVLCSNEEWPVSCSSGIPKPPGDSSNVVGHAGVGQVLGTSAGDSGYKNSAPTAGSSKPDTELSPMTPGYDLMQLGRRLGLMDLDPFESVGHTEPDIIESETESGSNGSWETETDEGTTTESNEELD